MSEHIVKIIPTDPFYKVQEQTLQSAKSFLQSQISCDFIGVELNEMPVFVDCGANLEMISCPECNAKLDFDWWGETMDKAADNAFASLEIETPCCKKRSSLNDLNYYFPCGFACCIISIFNPEQSIENKIIDTVQNILDISVHVVESHM